VSVRKPTLLAVVMGSAVNDTASSDTTIQMAVPVRSGKIARRSSGNFKTFNSSRSGAIRACSGTRAVFSFFTRYCFYLNTATIYKLTLVPSG
jgi:hypothetical protein